MKYRDFVLLVAQMRTAQLKYFAGRGGSGLQDAKRLEHQVDMAVGKLVAEITQLENNTQLRMALGQSEEP